MLRASSRLLAFETINRVFNIIGVFFSSSIFIPVDHAESNAMTFDFFCIYTNEEMIYASINDLTTVGNCFMLIKYNAIVHASETTVLCVRNEIESKKSAPAAQVHSIME